MSTPASAPARRRATRVLLWVLVVIGVVVGVGVGAELIARHQVEQELASSLPSGVQVQTHGLLTWGWVRGQIPLTATVSAAAVEDALSAQVDGIEDVAITPDAVDISLSYPTVLGDLPVSVTAVPALTGGVIAVNVQSVTVVGFTLTASDVGLDVQLTAQDLDLQGVTLTRLELADGQILVEGTYATRGSSAPAAATPTSTSATISTSATTAAQQCGAQRTIVETWQGGFKAEIAITSTFGSGWRVTWNPDTTIESFWGGNMTEDTDGITVTPYSDSQTAAAITLGYVGAGDAPTQEVSGLAVNGVTCGSDAVASATSAAPTAVSDAAVGTFTYRTDTQGYAAWQQAVNDSDTHTADLLEEIASQPQALWLTDTLSGAQARSEIAQLTAAAGQTVPLVVVYAIPGRDCGSYSAGGFSEDEYLPWITQLAAGITGEPWVVLEPDALANLGDCEGQGDRVGLLRQAAAILTDAGARVYLDVGHSDWLSAQEAATRLRQVGLADAVGFALNVSNYQSTADSVAYAQEINSYLGQTAHYLIDTSRNGNGAQETWCNPLGAALGDNPRIVMQDNGLDALAWVKLPGESDGTCNGGPAAGQWWQDMALRLAQQRS